MKKDSRVKAVISLDAVEHNFREMRKNIAEETKMIAVIKADAYGHGAVPVAHLIEDYDYIWGICGCNCGRSDSSARSRDYKTNPDPWNCF